MFNYPTYPYPQQQRLQQLEQQFVTNSQPQMTIIPVTNINEANAYRVDVYGTPTFFYNAGTNEIYMKRTNVQTGLADFKIFGFVEKPLSEENSTPSVNGYEKDLKVLNDKIDGLYSLLSTNQVEEKSDQVTDQVTDQVKPVSVKGGKSDK